VIIFRYLSKEIIAVMLAVLIVLLMVFVSTQLAIYLSKMANGQLTTSIFLNLAATMIPILTGLLLPMSFFVAILLAYGRVYAESEMTVLYACGMTRFRLLLYTMILAFIVTALVAYIELFWSPQLMKYQYTLLQQSIENDLFGTIRPGHFQDLSAGQILYVEGVSQDRKTLYNVFVVQPGQPPNLDSDHPAPPSNLPSWDVVVGETGSKISEPERGGDYLVIKNGTRYIGAAGQTNFLISSYGAYGVRLPEVKVNPETTQVPAMSSEYLLKNYHDKHYAAELQWRLSVALQTFILALLAVPLSRTRPRQGRYASLVPSLLIYLVYANSLFLARDWVDKGKVNIDIGIWWVHVALLLLAAYLYLGKPGWGVREKFSYLWRSPA